MWFSALQSHVVLALLLRILRLLGKHWIKILGFTNSPHSLFFGFIFSLHHSQQLFPFSKSTAQINKVQMIQADSCGLIREVTEEVWYGVSPERLFWVLIPREAVTGIGEGRGTGPGLWPSNRWTPWAGLRSQVLGLALLHRPAGEHPKFSRKSLLKSRNVLFFLMDDETWLAAQSGRRLWRNWQYSFLIQVLRETEPDPVWEGSQSCNRPSRARLQLHLSLVTNWAESGSRQRTLLFEVHLIWILMRWFERWCIIQRHETLCLITTDICVFFFTIIKL